MSKRYSERLIETFRDDELSKLNEDGLQGRNGTTSRIPRQCSGDESLHMYRSAHGSANPFRCRACDNPHIKAFATMYAQGTSTAVSMKGFLFKHSYQKTWRQTEMAKMSAPPRKKAFWPTLLLLAIAAGGAFSVQADSWPTAVCSRVVMFSFLLVWLGLYLGTYRLYWNLRYFPQRMTEYHRLQYCPRCARVTRV
jgi:hypothetical protein